MRAGEARRRPRRWSLEPRDPELAQVCRSGTDGAGDARLPASGASPPPSPARP
jgi:hypothetical protein